MSLFYKPIVDINNSFNSELMAYVNILTLTSLSTLPSPQQSQVPKRGHQMNSKFQHLGARSRSKTETSRVFFMYRLDEV